MNFVIEIIILGIILIIIHEIGHAIAALLLGKFKKFGIIIKYLMPYVEFETPLNAKQAFFGWSSGLIFSAPLAIFFDLIFPHELAIYLVIWIASGFFDILMIHALIKEIEVNPFFSITDKTTFKVSWGFESS